MKTKLLIVATIILVLQACKKDQFTTKPQLTFKSINSTVFSQEGQLIEITLEYTDKEGDIQNTIYVDEKTKDPYCIANDTTFRVHYIMPQDVPQQKEAKGEIVIKYLYRQLDPNGQIPIFTGPKCQRNDTCVLRFALTDKANNTSDTVVSPQIVFVY